MASARPQDSAAASSAVCTQPRVTFDVSPSSAPQRQPPSGRPPPVAPPPQQQQQQRGVGPHPHQMAWNRQSSFVRGSEESGSGGAGCVEALEESSCPPAPLSRGSTALERQAAGTQGGGGGYAEGSERESFASVASFSRGAA